MSALRNLAVPYFSQRENDTIWKEYYSLNSLEVDKEGNSLAGKMKSTVSMAKQSCNITCLAMILHYFGVTDDSPDKMMRMVFSPTDDEKKTYTKEQLYLVEETYGTKGDEFFEPIDNLKRFAESFYKVTVETSTVKKIDDVKKEISAGFPVLVSCGLLRAYDESEYVQCSKNEAYAAVFTIKLESVGKKDYDNKQIEYTNQITENETKLKEVQLPQKDKEELEKKLEEIKKKKEKLEKEYEKIFKNYLNDYRYHGHYIVIRGFTDNGIIINDPWGKPVLRKNGKADYGLMTGDNIEIPNSDFDKQYFADKHLYSCLIIREKNWSFISHNDKYDVNNPDFLINCHEAELFEHGGYPIKRSNLWHNGLHFGSSIGSHIYPIGPGQLIAARIINKDTDTNEEPLNGSRCFVLIKHQTMIESKLKDFFVCYMHLKEINDFESIAAEYPKKKTAIKWVDEILERTQTHKRVSALLAVKDKDFYEVNDVEGKKSVGKLPNSGVFITTKVEGNKVYFYYGKDNSIKEYWVNATNILPTDDVSKQYKDKTEELKKGKVVYFSDITNDSMLEVSNSTSIGVMGEYSGITCLNSKPSIHFEVFSNDVIIPQKDQSKFTIIKESGLPSELKDYSSICNRTDMIKFFEQKDLYGNYVDVLLNLKEDGVISKSEMLTFYNSYEYSKVFENYICQHISEWSDKIDWEKAFEKANGVPNKEFLSFLPIKKTTGEEFEGTLKEYVDCVYKPYNWFNKDCISAMKTEGQNYFNQGKATFYHPARFILWLNENEKKQ